MNSAVEDRIRRSLEQTTFAKFLGIELESLEPGVAVVVLELSDKFKQNNGVIHGGVIASLIDTALALAILSVLPEGERVTTIDLTISYLRPLIEGKARATARVLRAGKRVIAASAEVAGDNENVAATALSTYIKLAN
jgi:acyl-CoA thioesterase